MTLVGKIEKVSGPVIKASGLKGIKMFEVVRVGEEGLLGEVIELEGDIATVQVYEETSGLKPGARVEGSGQSLSVTLGPGLLGNIYDGILRPLDKIKAQSGSFLARGVDVPSIDESKKWTFKPLLKIGDKVSGGEVFGEIKETPNFVHKCLIPPDVKGEITSIKSGKFNVKETICKIKAAKGKSVGISLSQSWPVRVPRPIKNKFQPSIPLVTGQRIIDTFNPVAKGGTASTPGPFGTGKTVTQQSLAKYCDADIIIYIGCGERGNEMTDVLESFPKLIDPRTGRPLLERTVIIANTSNMPVAAREASIYTGITIAEYFRDQGYAVALMADSTSRWAEAMREISGRLEEMPGEEGYPAYLASRLSQFYERAGRVHNLSGEEGSITVVGAISPPGGDFSEPVTQNTLRVTKTFWALDKSLASKRHFPAINWLTSYTLYLETVTDWYKKNAGSDWRDLRDSAMSILQKEESLQEIVQLVGPDALPDSDRLILDVAKMLREDFLQQNAFDKTDAYCSTKKQYWMLKTIMEYRRFAQEAVEKKVAIQDITGISAKHKIARMSERNDSGFEKYAKGLISETESELKKLKA